MKNAILILTLWIGFGLIGAGWTNAYLSVKYKVCNNGQEELGNALVMGIVGGPIATFVSFFMSGFGHYGWSLSPNVGCDQ